MNTLFHNKFYVYVHKTGMLHSTHSFSRSSFSVSQRYQGSQCTYTHVCVYICMNNIYVIYIHTYTHMLFSN